MIMFSEEGRILRFTVVEGNVWGDTETGNMDNATHTYYPIKDHQNTVLALADKNGDIVESYDYDAYGRTKVFSATGTELTASAYGNRYTFQGREIDWATGLVYFRARWYNPEVGRWLSKDPIGISGGMNLYVFCGGNSVNFVDPSGLCGKKNRIELSALGKTGLALVASGQAIIHKNSIVAKTIWQRSAQVLGARKNTSLASLVFRRIGLGGAAGRAVPYVGWALTAYEAGGIIVEIAASAEMNAPTSGITVGGVRVGGVIVGGVRVDGIVGPHPPYSSFPPLNTEKVDGVTGADRARGIRGIR